MIKNNRQVTLPLKIEEIESIHAGDIIELSGVVFTMRDQAHKRLIGLIEKNQTLPFNLKGSVIYYCGPTPSKPGEIIGACGPTTSKRMDIFTEKMLEEGVKGFIGKGPRNPELHRIFKKFNSIYFHAYGGCAALYSEKILTNEIIAFQDLGTEAIHKITIRNFPVLTAIDCYGESIFDL